MKHILILIGLLISALQVSYAQTDSLKFNEALKTEFDFDSLTSTQWLDLDNNDTLELVTVLLPDTKGTTKIIRLIPDSANGIIAVDTLSIDLTKEQVLFADMDNNNGLDIVTFQDDQLEIWYHQDSLKYESKEWLLDDVLINTLQIADLTQNGKKEILINGQRSGEDQVIILERDGENWLSKSIDITADLVTVVPFEEVGTPKIISFGNDSIYIHSFDRDKQIILDSKKPFLNKVTAVHYGDLNSNNQLDLILSAEETAGIPETFIYYDFKNLEKIDTESFDFLFVSDFNSDGLTDIYSEKDSVRYFFLQTDSLQFERSEIDSLLHQKITFGDYDTDGDLDLASFDPQLNQLTINSNESGVNEAPNRPAFVVIFQGNDAIALYWAEASDDQSKILTYDLQIGIVGNESDYKTAFFNTDNGFRRGVRHGNMGTQRFGEFINFPAGAFSVKIQTVDNSYYGSDDVCEGGGVKCDEIAFEDITICSDELLTFTNTKGQISHWYSYEKGYLGLTDTLQYFATENDVLYTVGENATSCDDYKYWNITVEEAADISVIEDIIGCEGEPISIDISDIGIPFDSLQWSLNGSNGSVPLFSDRDSLTLTFEFLILENTQIFVEGYVGSCMIKDSAQYTISKPAATVTPEFAEILLGESVMINGTAGYNYAWSPTEGLDDPAINNPIATPDQSITYFATITDSLNCSIRDSVIIDVNQAGFAAELFTPNNDGRNDRFVLHELNGGDGFQFKITDKRGNVVFKTETIEDVTRGWDGTSNGINLPSGSYLWEVRGTFEGKPILVNGVQKGIINLIR